MAVEILINNFDEFGYKMIKNNDFNELISINKNIHNDSFNLLYDNTNYQSLKDYSRTNTIKASEVIKFLNDYLRFCKKLDSYMLYRKNVFLDEEHIFVGESGLKFIYVLDKNYSNNGNILSVLLNLNISDENHILYELYRLMSLQENDDRKLEFVIKKIESDIKKQSLSPLKETANNFEHQKSDKIENISFNNNQNILNRSVVNQAPSSFVIKNDEEGKKEKSKKKGFNLLGFLNKKNKDVKHDMPFEEKTKINLKTSKEMQFDEEAETTVLGANDHFSVNKDVQLIRAKNQELIKIDTKKDFTMGSSIDNSYQIKDNTAISRKHVKIMTSGNCFYVCDLHSTNGVYINANKLPKGGNCQLNDGDVINIGNEEFLFKVN